MLACQVVCIALQPALWLELVRTFPVGAAVCACTAWDTTELCPLGQIGALCPALGQTVLS